MQDISCTYRTLVKAIIRDDDGRVLLIRESDGRWELPGGGLEHGEDPRTGLIRKIEEELGLPGAQSASGQKRSGRLTKRLVRL